MPVNTRYFKDKLADAGLSQREFARRLGVDHAALSLMLRGKRNMKLTEAAEIARLLGIPAQEVIENAGVRIASENTEVAISGWVDHTGEVHQGKVGTVAHPGQQYGAKLQAVQCRTGDFMDGWLLFGSVPNGDIVTEAVGRLAFCKLSSGVIVVASPVRSYQRGRWRLENAHGTMDNAALEWATPVVLIQP